MSTPPSHPASPLTLALVSNTFPGREGLILGAITGAFDASSFPLVFLKQLFFTFSGVPSVHAFFTGYAALPIAMIAQQLSFGPAQVYERVVDHDSPDGGEVEVVRMQRCRDELDAERASGGRSGARTPRTPGTPRTPHNGLARVTAAPAPSADDTQPQALPSATPLSVHSARSFGYNTFPSTLSLRSAAATHHAATAAWVVPHRRMSSNFERIALPAVDPDANAELAVALATKPVQDPVVGAMFGRSAREQVMSSWFW